MVKLIKDLINFEPVEEVIKIRKTGQETDIVSKYVISDKIKSHLLYMFELLSSDTHKSFNVVGNYGTGKSHFLAFVSALLENKECRELISDAEVKKAVQAFNRQFAVVKFECPAAQEVPLRKIFYDNVQEQLEKKYDLDIDDIDLQRDYDNKKNIQRIVEQIKEDNPELGLLVIVDEISDFLKQKNKTDMTYDLNFLREIGEVSQETDFLYIGAMQEHVFTNPKYIDQAENIARIAERFVDITITKEDINRVISQRIVNKTANQRMELENLLTGYRSYFTNIAVEMDKYIDLFPIHPYVISVFEDLPYFENRGIIHFSSKNVTKILGEEAPKFITYDLIYDLIDETHEIRNLEEISEVINVVKALEAKVDLLDERFRDPAKKIIKALAVLKMLAKTHLNGATVQELANTLLITPPSQTVFDEDMAKDNLRRILHNVIKVTNGQFVDYDKESDFYFLNIDKKIDFDVLIEKQIEKQDKADWEVTFKRTMSNSLALTESNLFSKAYPYIFDDTTFWKSRRSFREGYIIVGKKEDGPLTLPERDEKGRIKDYTVILHSPFANHEFKQSSKKELIVGTSISEGLLNKLKRISATEILSREGAHRQTFNGILKKETEQFTEKYLIELTTQGYVIYGGVKEQINDLPPERYGNVEDVLGHLKSYFFETYFTDEYPKYPKFKRDITSRNINAEISKAISSLDKITSLFGLEENAQSYLESFGAVKDGKLYFDESEIAQLIIERVTSDSKEGRVTLVEDVLTQVNKKPYGIQKEFIYFLLAGMLYNGEIAFVKNGGGRIFANEFSEQFKKGLDLFEEIKYIEQERDLPVAILIKLFDALNLQSGLIKNKNSRTDAVRELNSRTIALKQDLTVLENGFTQYNEGNFPELPWTNLRSFKEDISYLEAYIDLLLGVKKVADFSRLGIDCEWVEALKEGLSKLTQLKGLVNEFSDIKTGLEYQRLVSKEIDKLEQFFEDSSLDDLKLIENDQKEILGDLKRLLKEDERRPLKGKFALFKDKYKKIYYQAHEGAVGKNVNWNNLDNLTQSNRFKSLNQLKNLPFFSPAEFNEIALGVNKVVQYRCMDFDVDSLEHISTCPHCHFPVSVNVSFKVDKEINSLNVKLESLWIKWETELMQELSQLQSKIELLSKSEYKKTIEDLTRIGKLPEIILPELISALMELASDLEQVEFNLNTFYKHMLGKSSVLTLSDLDDAFAEFKANLMQGQDVSKIRFRIVANEEGR